MRIGCGVILEIVTQVPSSKPMTVLFIQKKKILKKISRMSSALIFKMDTQCIESN